MLKPGEKWLNKCTSSPHISSNLLGSYCAFDLQDVVSHRRLSNRPQGSLQRPPSQVRAEQNNFSESPVAHLLHLQWPVVQIPCRNKLPNPNTSCLSPHLCSGCYSSQSRIIRTITRSNRSHVGSMTPYEMTQM